MKSSKKSGYKIHFDRLNSVNDSKATRTHKFKCRIDADAAKALYETLHNIDGILHEDLVKKFLIPMYKMGFIFADTFETARQWARELSGTNDDRKGVLKDKLPDLYAKVKDFDKFFRLMNTSWRVKKDRSKEFKDIFGTSKFEDEKLKAFFDQCQAGLNSDQKYQFFGLKKDEFKKKDELKGINSEKNKQEPNQKPTFVYVGDKFTSPENADSIDRIYFFFQKISTELKLKKVANLAGVTNNQNGLSCVWGVFLKKIQDDNADEAKKYIREMIQCHRPDVNDESLVSKVYDLASPVALKIKEDVLAENWSKYRNQIGGRLQSWLSNFENRLKEFEETIVGNNDKSHSAVWEKIDDSCNWKKIFPPQEAEIFGRLKESQENLRKYWQNIQEGQINEDVRQEFDRYAEDLRVVHELLKKWNNQGIKPFDGKHLELIQDSNNKPDDKAWVKESFFKKINGNGSKDKDVENPWPQEYIFKPLHRWPRFIKEDQGNPKNEIGEAKNFVLDLANYGEAFCQWGENVVEEEAGGWLSSKKCSQYGEYHKKIDRLRVIALHAHGKDMRESILKFINSPLLGDGLLSDAEDLHSIRFYVSGYEKRQPRLAKLKECSRKDLLESFEQYFGLEKNRPKDFYDFLKIRPDGIGKDILTQVELLKWWWSLRVKGVKEDALLPLCSCAEPAKDFAKKHFSKLLSWDNINLKGKDFHRLMNAGFAAEIRGKVSLLTRQFFIERVNLQIENGGQSGFSYVSYEWQDFSAWDADKRNRIQKRAKNAHFSEDVQKFIEKQGWQTLSNTCLAKKICEEISKENEEDSKKMLRILAEMPHRWEHVVLFKKDIAALKDYKVEPCQTDALSCNRIFFEKSTKDKIHNLVKTLKGTAIYAFPIETSRYQKQFLDKFLWGFKDHALRLAIQGPSIIMEKDVAVGWENGQIQTNDRHISFYVAIPFGIEKMENNQGEKTEEGKILAIDLSEYGFGWAVFDKDKKKFPASSFYSSNLLPKLREEVSTWKKTQSKGIFSRPTTYLADLREKAAGELRNHIHHLAIDHNVDVIVYEASVDGFESGGQRIKKLYKTLKKSDVQGNTDADKSFQKHIWGSTKSAQKGRQISPAYTSQTCRTCGECVSEKKANAADRKKEIEKKQRCGFYEVRNEHIYVPGKEEACVSLRFFSGSIEDGYYSRRDILKRLSETDEALKQYLQRTVGYDTKKKLLKKGIDKNLLDIFFKIKDLPERGSSARFICQNEQCGNHADADVQAAKNIALKFYFKGIATEEDRANEKFQMEHHTEKFSPTKFFLAKSKEDEWKNL